MKNTYWKEFAVETITLFIIYIALIPLIHIQRFSLFNQNFTLRIVVYIESAMFINKYTSRFVINKLKNKGWLKNKKQLSCPTIQLILRKDVKNVC
ncbi:hypothetical protein [Natronincola ferrireducens]|uniref:Uncharacterized protein n=1 Tax=Natronincola ferrireducens TaxID=393762 RepID=A0A1G9GFA7_9FIRM|nr:hypothetical protein [Natronincola ferrireducens]SDK99336.1 hypothetical protein SAMN05660472_02404 [Natronincola ferrireducens]